ncbi:hypothetical protein XNC1_2923 [Xenorhabdus nematophila ATCC 19061]|uniref:Uncharacterized protein n=1 Tax=Xenorhabdus nematophila (strain ATCC 19061 / DSM 3370 / CCUG 14189 / LMG 1036 / NCIMB 9965 / AN6) TaxID=406817 RepID=D3VJR8_XENNA|nr:hypothetical protein [Xenorhabdus nematophila]CBJ90977.1 hypothetical protein XNC1_2923 [Xenorhabdus nematophila ATCC 19061]CEK23803.1 hypothetical protein XNC2_2809 [Xenorhabdus nematophila AN6/1]
MSMKEIINKSSGHDSETHIELFTASRIHYKGHSRSFGNIGSTRFVGNQTVNIRNENGELNSLRVKPNLKSWPITINRINMGKSITLVGSWTSNKYFFYTTNNNIFSGQFNEISLTGVDYKHVIDLWINKTPLLYSGAWDYELSNIPGAQRHMKVSLLDDNINYSSNDDLSGLKQAFLQNVNEGDEVLVVFRATGEERKYTSLSKIEKHTNPTSINLKIKN